MKTISSFQHFFLRNEGFIRNVCGFWRQLSFDFDTQLIHLQNMFLILCNMQQGKPLWRRQRPYPLITVFSFLFSKQSVSLEPLIFWENLKQNVFMKNTVKNTPSSWVLDLLPTLFVFVNISHILCYVKAQTNLLN